MCWGWGEWGSRSRGDGTKAHGSGSQSMGCLDHNHLGRAQHYRSRTWRKVPQGIVEATHI